MDNLKWYLAHTQNTQVESISQTGFQPTELSLKHDPTLCHPDPEMPFTAKMDASGMTTSLSQRFGKKKNQMTSHCIFF